MIENMNLLMNHDLHDFTHRFYTQISDTWSVKENHLKTWINIWCVWPVKPS